MRRLVRAALLGAALATTAAPAQTPLPDRLGARALPEPGPATVSFQGTLHDGGQPVADGTHGVQIRIFHEAAGGESPLYVEDHVVTTTGGAFVLSIGAGTPVTEDFRNVDFADPTWVEVAVDGTTLSPRTPLQAAPVARSLAPRAIIRGTGVGQTLTIHQREGIGLLSEVTNHSAVTSYGVYGTIRTFGAGVFGVASSFSGAGFGVHGQSHSDSGTGVYGEARRGSGITTGVFGESRSTSGRGVHGSASATSGTAAGVFGTVASPDGYAGHFRGGRGLRVHNLISASVTGPADAALTGEDLLVDAADAVVGLYSTDGGTWGSALALAEMTATGALATKWAVARRTGATGGLYFTFGPNSNYGANDAQMRIQTNGTVRADGSFVGGGADLAEYFPASVGAAVRPGDLVGLRGGAVSLAASGAEQVMIASTDPAFVGNPGAEAGGALVALVGQAEVRLSGPASVGDLLVASGRDDGTARAVAPAAYDPEADGPVAGRVLSVPEAGWAVALVGVDEAAALRDVVARQQVQIDALTARLDALLRRLDPAPEAARP